MKTFFLCMRSFWVVVFFLVSLTFNTLCYGQEPIRIGWVGPVTGTQALLGKYLWDGWAMGFEEINTKGGVHGIKTELLKEDSEYKPALAVNCVQKLITKDNVVMVYVGAGSTETLAVIPIMMKAKVAHITNAFSPIITQQGSKYVFRNGPTTDDYGKAVIEYAIKKKGFKKFGIIADPGVFGQNQADSYEKALGEFGLKVVSRQKFNVEDRDFTGQLLTIQRAGTEVLCLSTTEIEAGLIAKQAIGLGMKFQFISPQAYAPYVQSGGNEATNGSLFAVAYIGPEESERARKFAEKFRAKYNYEPMVHNVWGYDSAYLVAIALEKAYPNITRETFRDALASLCKVTLVQGTYCFDERGEGISMAKVAIIRGGKVYLAP